MLREGDAILRGLPPPVTPIFRVGRGLDPLAAPDWPYAHGNRFDDPGEVDGIPPEARFRVV
ncbi:MAG: hypothetical protein M3008_08355, partial [Chloroflexota bacterium]|nr:hypothetical protein [Chloroflexota bacterium]